MTRKQRSVEQWQALVESQRNSGLSIKDYCKQHHIRPSAFYQWRKRFSDEDQAQAPILNWLSLSTPSVKSLHETWQIELALPNGVMLRMNSGD